MLRLDFEPLVPNLATIILQCVEFARIKKMICIICVNYYFFTITLFGSCEKCNSKLLLGLCRMMLKLWKENWTHRKLINFWHTVVFFTSTAVDLFPSTAPLFFMYYVPYLGTCRLNTLKMCWEVLCSLSNVDLKKLASWNPGKTLRVNLCLSNYC